MPIPDCIQDHYGVPPEEYWNENYFKLDATYFEKEIRTLKNLYDFKAGHKALDIGAGIGKCLTVLTNAGFEVFGFEPSQSFRTRAIDKMNIRPDRLKLASIENADFPDDFFDFITFGAVLEHLYDPAASINQAMNWLRPGGIMHIEVPSSKWLISRLVNAYYRAQGLDYVTNISPMHEPFHLYEFSLSSFEHSAIRNQYEIVHSDYYVCDTFMPNVLAGLFGQYMKLTKKGMQLCVWLRKK
ncbi:MAG: methyltransferase domain-containing protein [Cyclobacteriaceae bacterium]|nr:methyltransferase domain-containing protein [Cyclobacteriaceae bacterium]